MKKEKNLYEFRKYIAALFKRLSNIWNNFENVPINQTFINNES